MWPAVALLLIPAAWSPDHQVVATAKAARLFVTPEGANYLLRFNGQAVYPKRYKADSYTKVHTFLSALAWSPDSDRVAVVEEIYSWEYADPFNSDFEGWVPSKHYYLAVISRSGVARGYKLKRVPDNIQLRWQSPEALFLNGQLFDLRTSPAGSIP